MSKNKMSNTESTKINELDNSIIENNSNESEIVIETEKKIASKAVADKNVNVSNATVKVTQIASGAGRKIDQIRTLTGLGLGKINRSRVLEDTPSIRGMINKVKHLVKFEAV